MHHKVKKANPERVVTTITIVVRNIYVYINVRVACHVQVATVVLLFSELVEEGPDEASAAFGETSLAGESAATCWLFVVAAVVLDDDVDAAETGDGADGFVKLYGCGSSANLSSS